MILYPFCSVKIRRYERQIKTMEKFKNLGKGSGYNESKRKTKKKMQKQVSVKF